jgi:hypothetical protein
MSSPSPAVPRPWPPWVSTLGWSLFGLLLGGGLLYVLTLMFGTVNGTEFCPETFERRHYHYVQLPLVHLQITGEDNKDTSGATEIYVTSQPYFTKKSPAKPQWHTITAQRGARTQKGDAHLLVEYLDAKNSDDYHRWVKWSEDYPKLAAELWPAVQKLAEARQYVAIPDAFDLAKAADDPVALKQQLGALLKSRLAKSHPPAKSAANK